MTTTDSKSRLHWVDAAKGVVILLVVLTHAYSYSAVIGAHSDLWAAVNEVFVTLRMPVFFMLAGLFAMSWIRRSWRELIRHKVVLLLWVYMLWVVIRFVFFSFVPSLIYPSESGSFFRLFAQAIWSSMPTWFLYALAVFFIATKALSAVSVKLQLVVSGSISVVFMSDIVTLPSSLWTGLVEYFFFFLLGAYGRELITSLPTSNRSRIVLLLCLPLWGALAWTATQTELVDLPGIRFALALLALPAGMGLGVMFSGSTMACHLGRHTLPIYLGHALIQGGLAVPLSELSVQTLHQISSWLPVALVIVSTALSLFLYALVTRLRINGIYDTPVWLDRLISRSSSKIRL